MKSLISSTSLLVLAIFSMPHYAQAKSDTFVFTYDYEGAAHDLFGIQRKVQIDAAMLIRDPLLVGTEIRGISVDIPTKEGCSCDPVASAWLSKELRVEGEFNVPDIMEINGTITNYGTEASPEMRLEVTFPEPYLLTEEGVYVGYSVNVTDCNVPGTGWTSKYPIVTVCGIDKPGSFMIHCTKGSSTLPQKYPEWVDFNESTTQALAMRVIMNGELFENAASLEPQHTLYAATSATGYVYANLNNYGTTPITSFEYSYTLQGNGITPHKVTERMMLDTPLISQIGAFATLDLPIETPEVTGNYTVELHVDKVNNLDNEYTGSSILYLEAVPFLPVHRPLLEDYTSLSCGYCPSVYVTVKQMQDKYGDMFLPISYHIDDNLQGVYTKDFASDVYGYPSVYIEDRLNDIGYENIEKRLLSLQRELAPADLDVKLFWEDAEHKALRVSTTAKFVYDHPDANYMLAYALVEDEMSDPLWGQRNFYTKENYEGDYWDLFCGQPYVVNGIVFDDVVVSCTNPTGIIGSLPADISSQTEYLHSCTLSFEDATCKYTVIDSYGESLIKNPEKLRVIAILIDGDTGNVVNAASSTYSEFAETIVDNGTSKMGWDEAETLYIEYLTLSGTRLVDLPTSGIGPVIVVKHKVDGTVETEKIIL